MQSIPRSSLDGDMKALSAITTKDNTNTYYVHRTVPKPPNSAGKSATVADIQKQDMECNSGSKLSANPIIHPRCISTPS